MAEGVNRTMWVITVYQIRELTIIDCRRVKTIKMGDRAADLMASNNFLEH